MSDLFDFFRENESKLHEHPPEKVWQQLEQRLNQQASERQDGSDRQGKPPAGRIKSLTLRTGTEDDRLRIYWADGSTTDLPCTKEQATFVCG